MKLLEPIRRHPGKTVIVLLTLVAVVWVVYLHRDDLSHEALTKFAGDLPAFWFLALFMILPLVGFPISVFLVLAGMRFGFLGGMAAATVAIFFHNYVAFRLTHGLFRTRLRDFLQRSGYSIPSIKSHHRVQFTSLFAAIHGPPYAAKLYLLALTDIPFGIYYWVGASVYTLFSVVPVGAGSAVTTLNLTWIYAILGCLVLLPLVGYWLQRRFKADAEEIKAIQHPHE